MERPKANFGKVQMAKSERVQQYKLPLSRRQDGRTQVENIDATLNPRTWV